MTLGRNTHPWINTTIRRKINQKQKAHKKARKTKKKRDKDRYKRLQQEVQWEVRQANKKYMEEVSSDYRDNAKKFWSYIKSKDRHRKDMSNNINGDMNIMSNPDRSSDNRTSPKKELRKPHESTQARLSYGPGSRDASLSPAKKTTLSATAKEFVPKANNLFEDFQRLVNIGPQDINQSGPSPSVENIIDAFKNCSDDQAINGIVESLFEQSIIEPNFSIYWCESSAKPFPHKMQRRIFKKGRINITSRISFQVMWIHNVYGRTIFECRSRKCTRTSQCLIASVLSLKSSNWGRRDSASSQPNMSFQNQQEYDLNEPIFYNSKGQPITREEAGFNDYNSYLMAEEEAAEEYARWEAGELDDGQFYPSWSAYPENYDYQQIEHYDDGYSGMDDEMEAAYEEFLKSQVQGRHHH
ncbi:PAIP1 [Mytilus edulis]|uniref:PAIP1 n=1 Tax=Mytilus edulis TaxID=6550 RepID=A0A8S3QF97_MYTED|nr:PAIP1 [Mytilus edulis]